MLTAAGNSTRMGGEVKKEYITLSSSDCGRISIISSALYAFLSTNLFCHILITVPVNGENDARKALAEDLRIKPLLISNGITLHFTSGGSTRQQSVKNGLDFLQKIDSTIDIVLIHDAARPWITTTTIHEVLNGTEKYGASVPAITSVDTQKETDENGKIIRHLERNRIVSVQTPQGFLFTPLIAAHAKAAGDGKNYTDDTEIWACYAGDVYIVDGDRNNRKVTYQGDI